MKKTIFILLFFTGAILLNAQKTIYYPLTESKSDSNFEIKSIYTDDSETTVSFVLDCRSQLLYMSFKPERTFIKMINRNLIYSRSNKIKIGYQTIRRGDRIEFSITFKGVVPTNGNPFNIIIGDGFKDTEFFDVQFETNNLGELRRKVDLGDKNAQNELALKYYNGDQVPLDYNKALDLFKSAAENGLLVAYGNTGSLYLWGKGTDANIEKARQWFEAGVKLGDSHSQYYLATMYRDGNGILKNPQRAKDLFEKSANSGNKNAEYELAMMYKQENQLTEAFNWFMKSAKGSFFAEGNNNAQYELGLMYYYAKGTSKNNQEAAYWIKKAYENGHSEAKKVWDGLELWKYESKPQTKKDIKFVLPQLSSNEDDHSAANSDLVKITLNDVKQSDEAGIDISKLSNYQIVYDKVEIMPSFPGGQGELNQFISTTLIYPAIAAKNGIQGRVVLRFVVDKDGTISDIKIQQSVDSSLDKEAIRVVKAMPQWSPGMQEGEPVSVSFMMPINFRLTGSQ